MTAGSVVLVDWGDALTKSGEPNKRRPGIVVSSPRFFGTGLPFEIVIPMTSTIELAIAGASVAIPPTPTNGCTKLCYALSWSIQTVPHRRLMQTASRITPEQLAEIRGQIASCVASDA